MMTKNSNVSPPPIRHFRHFRHFRLFRGLAFGLALGALAAPAFAQEQGELPPEAYDAFARISLVTTAKNACPGARVNDRALNREMVAVMQSLAAAGVDPTAAVTHLGTAEGAAQIEAREKALRARHGAAPEGAEALCEAIKAETRSDKSFGKMIRLP